MKDAVIFAPWQSFERRYLAAARAAGMQIEAVLSPQEATSRLYRDPDTVGVIWLRGQASAEFYVRQARLASVRNIIVAMLHQEGDADELARIYAGAVKFRWPEPFIVVLRNHMAAQGIDVPLPTIAANGTHIGIAEPVIMNGRKGNQAKPVSTEPVPTLDTKGGVWLAEPMVLSQHNSGAPRSADEPLPTITTGGAGAEKREGCARPMLVTVAHGNDAKERDPNTRRSNSVDEPLGTIHGDGSAYAVVEPFVLSRQGGGAPRSVDDPTPAQVAKHSHLLVTSYYGGSQNGAGCTDGDDPLPTVTVKDRFGIVVPVTHSKSGNGARDVADPIPTLTTAKGGEFAVVMPVTHDGGHDRVNDVETPLPTITGANRGELAFITAQHGERIGQAPRVHDVNQPAPTIAATGHVDLIEGTEGYDILFRMLEPHELAAAMGFNTEDQEYEFAGTKTEKIKQIGNAVSVAKMKACVGAIMADAAPKRGALVPTEFKEAAE